MTAIPGTAFHYIAVFPRLYEEPRPAWQEFIAKIKGVSGVVDAIFPDISAAWVKTGNTPEDANVETRRRFIEVYAKANSVRAAETTRTELLAVDEIQAATDAETYTLVTLPADDVVIRRGRPTTPPEH